MKLLHRIVILIAIFFISCLVFSDQEVTFTQKEIAGAEKIMGLNFTSEERDSLTKDLVEQLKDYEKIRTFDLPNSVPPALNFNPIPIGFKIPDQPSGFKMSPAPNKNVPAYLEDLAFWPVCDLAELIRLRKITSEQLTRMYIGRLKKYDPQLHCVISLTEDLALEQARRADREIAAGNYRGALHGIPYGAKDLLAVKGYKTTWGAMPFKNQKIDFDASVIRRLEKAGAVLVAKLTLGALAWGDVWFGEMTRNPWNLEQGSSGSSAGSASATAAGLVAFAIGTETWGSIISPSTRCGTTGLRPTFGRVSKSGAMALSWSMDKIGPICRTVEDCAVVFDAIYGPDGEDQSVIDAPFRYDPDIDLKALRIGYLKSAFEEDYAERANDSTTLAVLRGMGVKFIPFELPETPVYSISFILSAEAGAAFDDLTRSNRDDQMVRQIRDAWPNVFRASRFIPAVEYIQANRIRFQLIQQMHQKMQAVDLYLSPSFGGNNLLLTNLTGHPCIVLPNGFNEEGSPTSITFIGQLFDEGRLLAVARAYQEATDFHRQHPDTFSVR